MAPRSRPGTPQSGAEWQAFRLNGHQDQLTIAPAKSSEMTNSLSPALPPRASGWSWTRSPRRGQHVAVKQLVEDFARYLYLPRLRNTGVLLEAVREGLRLLTWAKDFSPSRTLSMNRPGATAACAAARWSTSRKTICPGLLVQPAPAEAQRTAETATEGSSSGPTRTSARRQHGEPCERLYPDAAQSVLRHRNTRSDARRKRCRPHCRRGHRALSWLGGVQTSRSPLRSRPAFQAEPPRMSSAP